MPPPERCPAPERQVIAEPVLAVVVPGHSQPAVQQPVRQPDRSATDQASAVPASAAGRAGPRRRSAGRPQWPDNGSRHTSRYVCAWTAGWLGRARTHRLIAATSVDTARHSREPAGPDLRTPWSPLVIRIMAAWTTHGRHHGKGAGILFSPWRGNRAAWLDGRQTIVQEGLQAGVVQHSLRSIRSRSHQPRRDDADVSIPAWLLLRAGLPGSR